MSEKQRLTHLDDRVRDVYSASIAEAASYTDDQLRATIAGTDDAGDSPEAKVVVAAGSEYDRLLRALRSGTEPQIEGIALAASSATNALAEAVERAARLAVIGVPVHSIVNAVNTTLLSVGEAPMVVQRQAAEALRRASEAARAGAPAQLADFVRSVATRSVEGYITERARAVEETIASFALERMSPTDRDLQAAREYIDGTATATELLKRLKARYGVD